MGRAFSNKKKTKNPFKLVPWWGWVGAVIFVLVLHSGLYFLSKFIVMSLKNTWWYYNPKIDVLDNAIPFFPYVFAQMYYVSYAVWFIVPLIVSVSGKKNFINFFLYSTIGCFVGFALFILMPARQDRIAEQIYEKIESIKYPFTKWMMTIIIKNDGSEIGWNMAPSFHVLSCLFCFLGLLRQKNIHCSARIINYVINTIIVIGTLFIKQHYVFDVLFALALGGIVYIVVLACNPGKLILDKYPNFLIIRKRKSKK